MATLGDEEGPGTLGEYTLIKRDTRGRYYATDRQDPGVLKVFGAEGRFLRTIGRRGRGPGEYEFIPFFHIGPGDSLHVFDVVGQRYTVLSPAYEVVRMQSVYARPVHDGYVYLANGDLVVSGVRSTPESFGFPLHRFTASGKFVLSFGTADATATPQTAQWRAWRRLAPAGGDALWAVALTKYVIELWDADGRKHRELVRKARWFEPYEKVEMFSPDEPPRPIVAGIRETRFGQLMVLIHVGDTLWRQWIEPRAGPDGVYYELTNPEGVFDTVIEVIDPEGGRLVISRRVDMLLLGFADHDHVYGYRLDDDYIPRYEILRIDLTHP